VSKISIHPTAVVSPKAELAPGVRIGPYAVIEGPCFLDVGVELGPHTVIHPYVRLGMGVKVSAHAVLGGVPQDLSFKGQETWLEVGPNTTIREGATLHRSTREDQPTRVGSSAYLMAYAHVAHDNQIGQEVILTNNVMLAGHVQIGSRAIVGGGAAVHQFVRIGEGAMVGGMAGVGKDILPFSVATRTPVRHFRLNSVGLRRRGIGGERYKALELAFRALREGQPLPPACTEESIILKAFLEAPSKRGIAPFVRGEEEE
jgi:UDP-N-acetylglucosamine acyltransferase